MKQPQSLFLLLLPLSVACTKEPISWNLPRNNAQDSAQSVNPANPRAPVARFNASTTRIPLGSKVRFSSTSTQNPDKFSWYLPGAQPSIASGSSVEATYNRLGYYDVTLAVSNQFGSDSMQRKAFIEAFYFKSFADKDWEEWFGNGWMFSSGQICDGCALAWQNSSSTVKVLTLSRDFINMPPSATLSFYYDIYSPGGYLRVRLNGLEIWTVGGYGKGNPQIRIPTGGNYTLSFEAIVGFTQSIYVNKIEIRP